MDNFTIVTFHSSDAVAVIHFHFLKIDIQEFHILPFIGNLLLKEFILHNIYIVHCYETKFLFQVLNTESIKRIKCLLSVGRSENRIELMFFQLVIIKILFYNP